MTKIIRTKGYIRDGYSLVYKKPSTGDWIDNDISFFRPDISKIFSKSTSIDTATKLNVYLDIQYIGDLKICKINKIIVNDKEFVNVS